MPSRDDDSSQLRRALQALQQMRARLDAVENARAEPIAIVGMSCRFPGRANSTDAFWRLLSSGSDAVTEVPAERWDAGALFDANAEARGRVTTRWGGFLDDVDRFDSSFFGIAPREASEMDPQQRLMLEVAWEALEEAGESKQRLTGSATGVFVGVHSHSSDYESLQMGELEDIGTYASTGTAHSIIANRLSYWLDLRGPSLAIDTACSSSLVAVHLAVRSLRSGECDLALAGGVNLLLTPEVTVALSRMRMMAADGRCKTFDARADGFVRGEGCGVVVLKRLSAARAAGDRILALIAGTAVNQDGATNGLTAPNGLSQRQVLRAALADGRVDPARVTFVEAHGTGTPLGDPIEVEAIAEVIGSAGEAPCMLGAVKTNIGHLEGAAGIAGLIKVVLALRHRTIPPNIHFRDVNPHLALSGTRLALPTTLQPWSCDGSELHAGVSSFGFGGTNAHVILREAPASTREAARSSGASRAALLPISAHDPAALQAAARQLGSWMTGTPAAFEDICYTAGVRRSHHQHRLAVVARTSREAAKALMALADGEQRDFASHGLADADDRRRLVFVFSGQGSQWSGMGQELSVEEPIFRRKLQECEEVFRSIAGWSLMEALSAPEATSRLHETEIAQPALFAIQAALAELWRSWGIVPDAVVGHSMGEVAAAHVAGALDLEQAIRIIYHRGRVMRVAEGKGRMAAVGLGGADVEELLEQMGGRVSLAAVNAPSSSVIAGDPESVKSLLVMLEDRGVFARMLPVALASHSPQMEQLRPALVEALAGVRSREPEVPLYSTVAGGRVRAGALDAEYWGRNLRDPVLFSQAISLAAQGRADFLEIAPHTILRTPIQLGAGAEESLVLGSSERLSPERQVMLASAGALFTRGYEIDWTALQANEGRVVALPAYPWQKQRFWIDSKRDVAWYDKPEDDTAAVERGFPMERGSAPFAGRMLSSPALQGSVFEAHLSRSSLVALGEHAVGEQTTAPAAALLELVCRASSEAVDRPIPSLSEVVFHQLLVLPERGGRVVQVLLRTPESARVPFEIHSRADGDLFGWTLHVTGTIEAMAPEHRTLPTEVEELIRNISTREGAQEECRVASVPAPGNACDVTPLSYSDGQMLARIRMSGEGDPAAGAGHRTPLLMDTCLRVLASSGTVGDQPGRQMVVATIARTRLSTPVPSEMICRTQMRSQEHRGRTELEGDVHLFDLSGSEICALEGVRFVPCDAGATRGSADEWLYEMEWRQSAIPEQSSDGVSGAPPRQGPWLVLSHDHATARDLATAIRDRGGECVVLLDGDSTAHTYPSERRIDLSDSTSVAAAVRSWREEVGTSGNVVYLGGSFIHDDSDAGDVQLRVRAGCSALAAIALVLEDDDHESSRLWLFTRSAQPVTGGDADPAEAALWGFGRSVALECPRSWGGMIDLGKGGNAGEELAHALDHITARDGEDQAAFRGAERYVPRLLARPESAARPVELRRDATHLITGGLGVLGLEVARWLAGQGATHIVLLGRTALPNHAEWNSLVGDSRLGRIITAISDLERGGTRIVHVAADVSDPTAISQLFARFGADLPPLASVFHAAGEMPLIPLPRLSGEELSAVLRPKVCGGWLLHLLTRHLELDHFVLFSSVAAIWGSRGMAHYAAGNHFLDAMAHHRRSRGLPALSVNWGGWKAGDGSRQAERLLAESDLRLMEPEEALARLGSALSRQSPQIAVASVDWRALRAGYEQHGRGSFLREIETGDMADIAPVCGSQAYVTELTATIQRMSFEEARVLLTSHVRQEVAAVLGVDAVQLIAPRQGFFRLGMDSLMTVELRGRLERSLGLRLPTTIAFEHPTVEALSAFLAGKLIAEAISAVTQPGNQVVKEERGAVQEALAELGEDELAVMLDGAIADLLTD